MCVNNVHRQCDNLAFNDILFSCIASQVDGTTPCNWRLPVYEFKLSCNNDDDTMDIRTGRDIKVF